MAARTRAESVDLPNHARNRSIGSPLREVFGSALQLLQSVSHSPPKKDDLVDKDLENDFSDSCKQLCINALKRLLLWSKGSHPSLSISTDDEFVIDQLVDQFQKGYVLICVYGDYNTGKSSVLNGLLQNMLLPVGTGVRTAIRTYIKHEESCHLEACNSTCEGPCPCCPKLFQFEEHTCITCGSKAIHQKLTEMNRASLDSCQGDVLLKAHIPVLKYVLKSLEQLEQEVYLVDNPGLHDNGSRQSVMLAEKAALLSSAYIYVMDYGFRHGCSHIEAMKELHTKDRDVFESGRITFVMNKFDQYYEDDMAEDGKLDREIAHLKENFCRMIEEGLDLKNGEITRSSVVLVSSKWALWYATYDESSPQKRKNFETYLSNYQMKVPPSQGRPCVGSPSDPENQCQLLWEGSRMQALQIRIEKMMWQMQEHWLNHLKQSTSLKIQFAMETIASSVQSMHSCAEEKSKEINSLDELRKGIKTQRELIEKSVAKVKEKLDSSFDSDIEMKKRGIITLAEEEHDLFTRGLNVGMKLDDFKEVTESYLEEITIKLKLRFGDITLYTVVDSYTKAMMEFAQNAGRLQQMIKEFCGITNKQSEEATIESPLTTSFSRPDPPNFCRLANEMNIPEFQPTFLQKMFLRLKLLVEKIKNMVKRRSDSLTQSGETAPSRQRLSQEQLASILEELGKSIKDECSQFFMDCKPKFVEHYHKKYKQALEIVMEELNQHQYQIKQQERHYTKLKEDLEELDAEQGKYKCYRRHLETLREHIKKECKTEILQKLVPLQIETAL